MGLIKLSTKLIVLLCFVLLVLPVNVWSIDGDLLWYEGLEIDYPQILLSDNQGGAIVVWATGGYPKQIRAQRYDDDGTQLWGNGGKVVSDATDAVYSAATEDMFGGIVVAYSSGSNIYAQRLNSDGNKQWNSGVGVLVLATVSPSEDPVITPDGAGGAYIGYRRKLNQVTKIGNVSDTNGYEFVPSAGIERFSMVYDGQRYLNPSTWEWMPGGVFLTWFSSSTLNIHAQHINAGTQWPSPGSITGALVSTRYTHVSISHQRLYRILRDGSGGLIVAWAGWEGFPDASGNGQIRVQRLNANGTPLWGSDGVALLDTSSAGGNPLSWWNQLRIDQDQITNDGSQGVILTWIDMRKSNVNPGDVDTYCQRVDSSGTPQWTSNGVWVLFAGDDITASGSEVSPAIASDGVGGAIISVEDYFQSSNIFANRLDSDGVMMWSKFLIWDDYSGGDSADQEFPKIIFDGSGPPPKGAIIAWPESGGSIGDSAQKVEISSTAPSNDDIANAFSLYLNCWNNQCGKIGSLYWATNDGSASCGYASQPDVWFKFTAPSVGSFKVNTCGTHDLFGVDSGIDTVLSLHSSNSGNQSDQIDCNDDASGSACSTKDSGLGRDSFLTHSMTSGETVYIRLTRYSEYTNGMYNLGWSFVETVNPCEGDINGDGLVNFADLAQLKANFFTDCSTLPPGTDCVGDLNNDGFVNFGDLALMKQDFFRGDCPQI